MALCIPIHLRQRTSRVYQDLPNFCRVPTSFVPPVHNQGVSLAPRQGPALWKLFLPTTGSFFVFTLTDLLCTIHKPAPFGGRFPDPFIIPFCFPATAEFNSQNCSLKAQFNCGRGIACFSLIITLPASAASGCHPSVYLHHNQHLL